MEEAFLRDMLDTPRCTVRMEIRLSEYILRKSETLEGHFHHKKLYTIRRTTSAFGKYFLLQYKRWQVNIERNGEHAKWDDEHGLGGLGIKNAELIEWLSRIWPERLSARLEEVVENKDLVRLVDVYYGESDGIDEARAFAQASSLRNLPTWPWYSAEKDNWDELNGY
ncbi:hypothetical protein BJ508DRAFT_334486 [Ascobolus immersus RN42]|uniref:Uncharacterized protein n=1 Tax=Ascobolus immersus RN42 TaxID=1160509 RepID=A0A3N4HJC9_ASCIM|nr:hypothetical protein BJ508DRAFT_334486 [Ascobolus immersus RN42]